MSLYLLPLTLWMELQDILLFLELLKNAPENFDVSEYVCFIESFTRSSTAGKIKVPVSVTPRLNSTRHHYFSRIMNIWNSLPPLDLDDSMSTLKAFLVKLYWNYFNKCFIIDSLCSWYRVCPCNSCASLPVPIFT